MGSTPVCATMSNINLHNVGFEEKALVRSYTDLLAFGKLFLSGDFLKSPTPVFHREIANEYLSPSNKPCAFILARESAKTIFAKAKILHSFCFAKKAKEWGFAEETENLFFGWCADSQKKSIKNVSYVRLHLKHNPKMKYYFGGEHGLVGDTDNQEEITTIWGDRLISSSNLTSMRGDTMATIDEGAIRYTCVFIDDAESEKNTITENSRERIVDNIMNGILPAIDKNKPGRTLFFSGTPVHYASFTQKILDQWKKIVKDNGGGLATMWTDDPAELAARKIAADKFPWRVVSYKSSQPKLDGGVLWHSFRPRKVLNDIKENYKIREGSYAGYYQEYELEVVTEDDALISRRYIKYYEGSYEFRDGQGYIVTEDKRIPINTFIGCDPATDIATKGSSFSVILVIGVDYNNNVYVLHYERHRAIPTIGGKTETGEYIDKKGVVDYIIELNDKFHCKHACVEDVTVTRSVFQALNIERRRLNKFTGLVVIPVSPAGEGSKLDRIYSSLSGRFASGGIYLKESQYDLITEISTFGPKMANNDTIDSLELACIRAYPPHAAQPSIDTEQDRYTGEWVPKKNKSRRARQWQV